jgi:hypothetical protein
MDTFQFMAQNGHAVFYVPRVDAKPYTRNRLAIGKMALSVDYLELLRRDSFSHTKTSKPKPPFPEGKRK